MSVAASVAAALVLCAAAAASAGPRRPGRVVRVQRPPMVLTTAARICSLFDEGIVSCDRPVQAGEVGQLLDDEANLGPATIRDVEPQVDACGVVENWKAQIQLLNPTASGEPPNHGLLVLDYAVDEHAHTLSTSGPGPRDGEQVANVVDRDGDGAGDLRVTTFSCDARGAIDRNPRPTHHCTDTWLAVRDRWQRARSDRVPVCDR